jgi:hypothetical protein
MYSLLTERGNIVVVRGAHIYILYISITMGGIIVTRA